MNFPARGTAWAYTGMTVAGLASIAANVLHALLPEHPPVGSVIAAGLWPVFLFVAIEILAKHEWPEGVQWILVRTFGLIPVAVVAAVVSYRHMRGLLTAWGEDPLTAAIGPIGIDGLLVMSTGAIIAAGMARHLAAPVEVPAAPAPAQVDDLEPEAPEVEAERGEHHDEPTPLLANATDRKVLTVLDGKTMGMSELARAADLPLSTTKNAMARLLEQGHVVKDGTIYRRRTVAA